MKITYRVPSKKVQYGYIEISADLTLGEALPDPEALAAEYADYISRYQAAEVKAFEKPQPVAAAKPDPVDGAAELMKEVLGASEVDGDDPSAPWNQKNDTSTESSKPSPAAADWDFD